jgi:hypothetical protein
MSATLAKALKDLGLRPGQTYRATVDGYDVEVRMLDEAPTPELADQVMLLPWVEFPTAPVGTVIARRGPVPLPDPPVIPAEDEEVAP